MISTKSELRQKYKAKRQTLSDLEIKDFSQKIFQNLIQKFSFKKGENVLMFLPIQKLKEIDTQAIIEFFWRNDVNVYLPKVIDKKIFSLLYIPSTLLEINKWGIQEPIGEEFSEVPFDKIIMPLLYADAFGNRIGYGKGFYDQFLSKIDNKPMKIGINYFNPTEEISDVDDTDIPLHYLVTPDSFFDFTTSPKSIK